MLAHPELEHQEAPQPVPVIHASRLVLFEQASHGVRPNQPRSTVRRSCAASRRSDLNQRPSGTPKPVLPRPATSGSNSAANARRSATLPSRPLVFSESGSEGRGRRPHGRGKASAVPASAPSTRGPPSARDRPAGRSRDPVVEAATPGRDGSSRICRAVRESAQSSRRSSTGKTSISRRYATTDGGLPRRTAPRALGRFTDSPTGQARAVATRRRGPADYWTSRPTCRAI